MSTTGRPSLTRGATRTTYDTEGARMNGWTWAWIAWILAFAAIEIPAIIRKNDSRKDPDSLSDHLVRWFHIRTTAGKVTWSVFILGLALWLWLHILTDQAV